MRKEFRLKNLLLLMMGLVSWVSYFISPLNADSTSLGWPVKQINNSFSQPQVLEGYGSVATPTQILHDGLDIPGIADQDEVIAPTDGIVKGISGEFLLFYPCSTLPCQRVFSLGHLKKESRIVIDGESKSVTAGTKIATIKDDDYQNYGYPDHVHFSYDFDLMDPELIKNPFLELATKDPGNYNPVIEEIKFIPDDYATETGDPKKGIVITKEGQPTKVSGKIDISAKAYDYMNATFLWPPINDYFRSNVYKIYYEILDGQNVIKQKGGWIFTGKFSVTQGQREIVFGTESDISNQYFILTNTKNSSEFTPVSEVDSDYNNPNFVTFEKNVWETDLFKDGLYTVKVTAYDAAGHQISKEQKVYVDNSYPEVALSSNDACSGWVKSGDTLTVQAKGQAGLCQDSQNCQVYLRFYPYNPEYPSFPDTAYLSLGSGFQWKSNPESPPGTYSWNIAFNPQTTALPQYLVAVVSDDGFNDKSVSTFLQMATGTLKLASAAASPTTFTFGQDRTTISGKVSGVTSCDTVKWKLVIKKDNAVVHEFPEEISTGLTYSKDWSGEGYIGDGDYRFELTAIRVLADGTPIGSSETKSGVIGVGTHLIRNVKLSPPVLQPIPQDGYKDAVSISYTLSPGVSPGRIKMYVWGRDDRVGEFAADFHQGFYNGNGNITSDEGGPAYFNPTSPIAWDGTMCIVIGAGFLGLHDQWDCDQQPLPSGLYHFQLVAFSGDKRVAESDFYSIRILDRAFVKLSNASQYDTLASELIAANGGAAPGVITINVPNPPNTRPGISTTQRHLYSPEAIEYLWDGRGDVIFGTFFPMAPGETRSVDYVLSNNAAVPISYTGTTCQGNDCPLPGLTALDVLTLSQSSFVISFETNANRAIPTVEILDTSGNIAKTLTDTIEPFMSGKRLVRWDGTDNSGNSITDVNGYTVRVDLDNLYGAGRLEKTIEMPPVSTTDTTFPVITHTQVSTALEGSAILFNATITDNVNITEAVLFYRNAGQTAENYLRMTKSGDSYTATLPAGEVGAPDIEYYLSASDGVNIARVPESPQFFYVSTYTTDRYITLPAEFQALTPKPYFEWLAVGSSVTGHQDKLLTLSSEYANDDVRVFGYTGGGAFTQAGSLYDNYKNYEDGVSVAAGDFDGNGKDELVLSSRTGNDDVRVFKYRNGVFSLLSNVVDSYGNFADGVNITAAILTGTEKMNWF